MEAVGEHEDVQYANGLLFLTNFNSALTELRSCGMEAVGEHEASPNGLAPSGSDLVRSVGD